MTYRKRILTATIVLGSLFSTAAMAQEINPYMRSDNTWISISGTVHDVTRNAFNLDYGDGVINVEMDDGDRDADAYSLLEGDRVTVNGMVDDDFFETASIEASSVYVEKLDTYFYASALDEEDFAVWYTVPVEPGQVTVQGTVTEIDGDDFVVNEGYRSIRVGTDNMAYDPLDDQGYQKVDVGDTVRVTGVMDTSLLENEQLEASAVITLVDSS